MKFIYFSIFIFSILSSCASEEKITFRHYEISVNDQRKVEYILKIPKGYTCRVITANYDIEKQYWYEDSAVVYISNMFNFPSLNYDNIKAQKDAYGKHFEASIIEEDTLTLEGVDSTGLLWKNKHLKDINIGYANVPSEKKETFDKILKSINKK